MKYLKLALLGSPQVELNGQPCHIQRRKSQALLLYLAVTGEPQQRDTLATLLWPESTSRNARAALRRDLSLLHKALGHHWLEIKRDTIALCSGYGLDVTHFADGIAVQTDQPDDAIAHLQQIINLYRADFLNGFTLSDCPEFDEWQFFQTESLRRLLVVALDRIIALLCQVGNPETAIPYALRRLSLDTLHEASHQQLMRLYQQTDQPTAALQQYQHCVEVLQNELRLSPSVETTNLYQAIRGGDQPLATLAATHHHFPAQTTPFVGRLIELAQIQAHLTDGDCRLLTLIGPGGIGKTRLALEAGRQANVFSDGIYFISLAPLNDSTKLVATLAEAVRLPFQNENRSPRQQLLDYFRGKQNLLILDNFEHLLAGVDLISAILETAPAIKVLVTSRERLNLSGERLMPLRGLTYQQTAQTDQLDAVTLFLKQAQQVRPTFQPTDTDLQAIQQICRWVDGMPLAILLAAVWVEVLTPIEIAAELEQSFHFLASDLRDLPPRHRSMTVVFEQTWGMLNPTEQAVFQQLSVFRGGLSRKAAEIVVGTSPQILLMLTRKSFLARDESGRFEIHELLRQYGAEKLAKNQAQYQETRQRHSTYYCRFLAQCEADLKGPKQQVTLLDIEAEHDNIDQAWYWAIEQKRVADLDSAIESLGLFFQWQGHLQEGEIAFRTVAEQLLDETSACLRLRIKVLCWQGQFLLEQGKTKLAEQALAESEIIFDHSGLVDQDLEPERAAFFLMLGKVNRLLGKPTTGYNFCQQSYLLYEERDDIWGMAEALDWQERALGSEGLYAERAKIQKACLTLRQELGAPRGVAWSMTMLGYILKNVDVEEAEDWLNQALTIFRTLGDQNGTVIALTQLAATLDFDGRFVESLAHYHKTVQISTKLGRLADLHFAKINIDWVYIHLGEYEQTKLPSKEAVRYYTNEGHNAVRLAVPLITLGQIAIIEENFEEAYDYLQQGLDTLEAFKTFAGALRGQLLGFTAHVAYKHEQLGQACNYFQEALQIALEGRGLIVALEGLSFLALFLAQHEPPEYVIELYAVASNYGFIANSRWFADVVGREIEAMAETLPTPAVEAAQARGRKRDLWETVGEVQTRLKTLSLAEANSPTLKLAKNEKAA